MNKNFNNGNVFFRLVATVIVVSFVFCVVWWVTVGIIAVKFVSDINESGMKTVIENVWEGKKSK